MLGEESSDQAVLAAAGHHGAQWFVQTGHPGRLAFALAIAELDQRRCYQGEVAALDLGTDGAQGGIGRHVALGGAVGVLGDEGGQRRYHQAGAQLAGDGLQGLL
ncbi:hypothetical protein D9M70_566170 [compost metagenome]